MGIDIDELRRLVDEADSGNKQAVEVALCEHGTYLARRVIAAEKLVEALSSCKYAFSTMSYSNGAIREAEDSIRTAIAEYETAK